MSADATLCDTETIGTERASPGEKALYVVGIGASAGGLDALEKFFDNVPTDSGMAFVLVQHLSPDFRSLMDEILRRRTEIPIRLVEDGISVEANHIYLIPPKKEMIISGGKLLLSERARDLERSLPIDVFFRSLAQDCGDHAIAVVLSGGGSDGSRGILAVHEAGGLVVVQDVESAQFDGMPKTARDAGVADCVLPPQDMPSALLQHARTSRRPTTPRNEEPASGMKAIYRMLEREFGLDFTHYKPSTITRRIERRIQLARADDVDEYVARLRGDRSELDVLYRDLLIGVTRFFRNEEAFEILQNSVLPELFQRVPRGTPFRVWVAACATGEEVYSIAILLDELRAKLGDRPIKIFATDVHRGSLEVATRALYGQDAVSHVSAERLEKYFVRRGDAFQVVPDLRQMIVFAPHDVIKDAPFTRVDLVSCRNMLIYLHPSAQQRVLSHFHFSLNRGGVVFLGPSESPGTFVDEFEPIDKHWRIYRKFSEARMKVDLHPFAPPPRTMASRGLAATHHDGPAPRISPSALLATYDALLEKYIPPSLLVTERGDLVHAFGDASKFLRVRGGRQGLDVLAMVDAELKTLLAGAMQRALHEPAAVVMKGIAVREIDPVGRFQVTVQRVRNDQRGGATAHLLISFDPMDAPPADALVDATEIGVAEVSQARVGALEAELVYTRENLQTATEQLESSNEELQAANEELLASNEELQSTNEELQSVNEELYSVNAEYQRKIADMTELANDMENLLSSTDIGTIFLDQQLKIRKFTPRIGETFKLLPQDVGRPIETFTHSMEYPELVDDLRRVLASGKPIEREVRDREDRAFFLRILPYRAKGAIDGVVITLIDVSGLKATEDALFHERHLLDSLLLGVPDAIHFKDAKGRFIRANHAMAARLGLAEPRAAVGKTGFELSEHEAALVSHQQDEIVLRTGKAQHYSLEKRVGRDGLEEWDVVTRLPLRDPENTVVGLIGVYRDVTEQKLAERNLREAVKRRDEFLAMLSHELRNPLSAVVSATSLLKLGARAPERQAKVLDVLERQSQQMARLLDDLLDASRVTQDKIDLRKRVVDLGVVAKDAVDAVRAYLDARGLELTVRIEDAPIPIEGDPARLQQIHVNLLNNAAKYTPRGGHVALEVVRDGAEAVVRVRDDGAGIPRHLLDTVFELFVQSTQTLDRSDGGLGVGLTLVRGLVTKHGGTVSASSEGEGKGSEFVVRLPLAQVAVETPKAREPSRAARSPIGSRVVVIDDNADGRQILCELLQLSGYECRTAQEGATGLALIEEVRPDVAIVDIGLPGIDGFEVARRIREKQENDGIYLIALTGYGQDADRKKALAAGFDLHMVKPVDTDAILRMLSDGRPRHAPLAARSALPSAVE